MPSSPVNIYAAFDPTPRPRARLQYAPHSDSPSPSSRSLSSLFPADRTSFDPDAVRHPRDRTFSDADELAILSTGGGTEAVPGNPVSNAPQRNSNPQTGGGEYTSDMGHGLGVLAASPSAGSAPSNPPSIPKPMTDPRVKSVDDREESEHQLEINRARRRQERDQLGLGKRTRDAKAQEAARERNLAGAAARKAEGMKNRPQNFNPDGTPKTPQQRVSSGTANDTDRLMAMDPESARREVDLQNADRRGAKTAQDFSASLSRKSAFDRLARQSKMRRLGLKPGDPSDESHYDDLLRLQ